MHQAVNLSMGNNSNATNIQYYQFVIMMLTAQKCGLNRLRILQPLMYHARLITVPGCEIKWTTVS